MFGAIITEPIGCLSRIYNCGVASGIRFQSRHQARLRLPTKKNLVEQIQNSKYPAMIMTMGNLREPTGEVVRRNLTQQLLFTIFRRASRLLYGSQATAQLQLSG